ncbi:MAG: sialic acid TRAP transporter substrate-binding protein SiaP [Rhodoferax sp.]|nr:sialic acid TRAP transporter substrate-binding protein SiaP [Rhodoferax sp.]
MSINRRQVLACAAAAATVGLPRLASAQTTTTIRWGTVLATSHPEVQMMERIAKDVKEKSGGRIDIQVFPNSQLGSAKDMIEAVSAGALQMICDGPGQLGAFLPALSVLEAPYLWRDAAHLGKASNTPFYIKQNVDLVVRRGMRMLNVSYNGKRHLTTGTKAVRIPADMVGFKLRVPPIDVFRAMSEAWGARATPMAFGELYVALKQGAVDGQENPLPTINSGKFFEVQKYLVLTQHIITPRLFIINDAFWKGLRSADQDVLQTAFAAGVSWQDKEILNQEDTLVDTFRTAGMTIIKPDLALWRKPVLDTLPALFAEKWGKGTFETLAAL